MSVIYEGEKGPSGLWPQFTNCCGATDKGVDNGVVCRNCYNYIEAYYGVGDEEFFLTLIPTSKLAKKFKDKFCRSNPD